MVGKKISSTDWRRQGQEKYLTKVSLVEKEYSPYRQDWDHDHCEFCGSKFSLDKHDLHHGYATTDCYHWICEQCFEDFSDEYQWKVEPIP